MGEFLGRQVPGCSTLVCLDGWRGGGGGGEGNISFLICLLPSSSPPFSSFFFSILVSNFTILKECKGGSIEEASLNQYTISST